MKCPTRKRTYRTELDAMLQLTKLQSKRNLESLDKFERAYYTCTKCGGIHLTSQEANA